MAKAARARVTRRCSRLPEEIIIWEILVRLPPKHLLRCRTVCRAWCRATSTHKFLLTHHELQPSLPIFCGFLHARQTFKSILAFDHRAAPGHQLRPVAELGGAFNLEASCDGLLVLSKYDWDGTYFIVCNPATLQHAPLQVPPKFDLWGMYLHRPTGEHRLLPLRSSTKGQVGCHVFTLGSNQPTPRYVGQPEAASELHSETPALLRDRLHWLLIQGQDQNRLVLVFDTIAESFRQMRAPRVPSESYIFEMDGTLGIYSCNKTRNVVNIWVLHNYEGEVWEHGYKVKLPVTEIRGQLGRSDDVWTIGVASVGSDILLLVSYGGSMFYVDIDGELVDNLHRNGQHLFDCGLRFKQTVVHPTFFQALEGYSVNSLPFV